MTSRKVTAQDKASVEKGIVGFAHGLGHLQHKKSGGLPTIFTHLSTWISRAGDSGGRAAHTLGR